MNASFRFSHLWISQQIGTPIIDLSGITAWSEFVHDSRQVSQTQFFIALPGERVDGHDFVLAALDKGVRGFIVSQEWTTKNPEALTRLRSSSATVFAVPSPLEAYRVLAREWRRRFRIPVFCIAGSVGKTTTKELITALLRGRFSSVLKTTGSQNGFVGIPMTLLALESHHEAAVIEVGIDEIGAMKQHLEIVLPTQSIVTAIGAEHLEKLVDLETVTREESIALGWTLDAGGRIALPKSDPYLYPYFQKTLHPAEPSVATYALTGTTPDLPTPTVRGDWNAQSGILKVIVTATGHLTPGEFELRSPLPGKHNALNLLGAATLALQSGVTPAQMTQGLSSHFQGAYGRSELQEIRGGIRVLCDYYNANPNSVRAALDTLLDLTQALSPRPKRWVCLADMLELGSEELSFHRELAPPLLQAGVDEICLFGERMRALHHELKTRAMASKTHHFATREAMAEFLASHAQSGDWVLIKGSRSMKMEEVFKLWKEMQVQ